MKTEKDFLNQMIHKVEDQIHYEIKKGNLREAHLLEVLVGQLIDRYMEINGIEF